MIIKYKKRDGSDAEYTLTDQNITLGRSPDADIIILDERASRMHASIRLHEGAHYVKDLESRNGTYVNGSKVDLHELKAGDKLRLGKSEFVVDGADLANPDKVAKVAVAAASNTPGTETVNREIVGKMDEGKGLKTIMREIVEEVEKPGPPKPKLGGKIAAAGAAAVAGAAGIAAAKSSDKSEISAETVAGVVEAVEENVFEDPGELGSKNTTMEIGDLSAPAEEAAAAAPPPTLKPKMKLGAKKPTLKAKKPSLKPSLKSKASKAADDAAGAGKSAAEAAPKTLKPKLKLGAKKPSGADGAPPPSPLKKRPTLKLKKPGS